MQLIDPTLPKKVSLLRKVFKINLNKLADAKLGFDEDKKSQPQRLAKYVNAKKLNEKYQILPHHWKFIPLDNVCVDFRCM